MHIRDIFAKDGTTFSFEFFPPKTPEASERLFENIRELEALHALLTLTHVGDPERDECAFFAALDPADPVVEEICLIADALESTLDALGVVSAPSTLAHARPSAA